MVRLLIVDDDDDLRATLAETLEGAGFEVAEATDGKQALRQLATGQKPDAILLDLMMPVMDGWEFRVEQKRDPALASTPVMVMTAATNAQAAAIDADVHVAKPFDRRTLLSSVQQLLSVAQRRRVAERLGHADRLASLGVMAAGLAHEINNPLAVLLLSLRLAEVERAERGAESPELESRLRDAREAAEHIQSLMREVVAFARPDTPFENVDLRAALESALAMLSSQLRSVARLERSHAPTPPVRASRAQLIQVFVNLLVNAVHAIDPDRPGVIRTRTFTSERGEAVVEVIDSGRGIAPDQLGRIFDPFYSTKPPGEGTGLGLSICQRVISALGGKIVVESDVGRSTLFRVVVPSSASGSS